MVAAENLDPVAARLAASEEEHANSVFDWLEGQQERELIRRRANWCSLSAYALIATAGVISTAVAILLGRAARDLPVDTYGEAIEASWSIHAIPWVMGAFAVIFIAGGAIAWALGRVPGLRSVRAATDWATSSDAVTRLLSAGCTYPEAYRTAAQVVPTGASYLWLKRAAEATERGQPAFTPSPFEEGDEAMVELLVEAGEGDPARRWQIVAHHFFEVARRRLALLLGALPIIATILSGILVWASVTTTLGYMWRAVGQMIRGLNF